MENNTNMQFSLVSDGEAEISGSSPVLPGHRRCCRIVRGLHASTLLKVVLPQLSDEGWFWEGEETVQVSTLEIDAFICCHPQPTKYSLQGKCCILSFKEYFRGMHLQVNTRNWTDGVQRVGTSGLCFTSNSFLPNDFGFRGSEYSD